MKNRENKNIYYDNKYIVKRILLTFRKNNLEPLGVHDCIVKEKAIVKPPDRESEHYVLFLETIDKKYSGMLTVSKNEYNKAIIDSCFGKCTIIKPYLRDECYFVNEENPDKALSKISLKSKVELLFLTLIILLFILSVIFLRELLTT